MDQEFRFYLLFLFNCAVYLVKRNMVTYVPPVLTLKISGFWIHTIYVFLFFSEKKNCFYKYHFFFAIPKPYVVCEVGFEYSRTLLIQINWDGEPSGYAENPDKWILFENRLHWQFEFRLLLFTVCTCI